MYHEGHAAILNRLRIESLRVKKKAVNGDIKIIYQKIFSRNIDCRSVQPLQYQLWSK